MTIGSIRDSGAIVAELAASVVAAEKEQLQAPFNTIRDAIEQIAAGRPVVVVDDEDRENEGDLVMAAENATEEQLAFLIRHTCGIVCAPLSRALAERLHLPPMVAENKAPLATAFTVSVDYRAGLTTGISASERAATLRALADPASCPEDFVRPGHVFPLIARDGGVLTRSGHTEAAIDLAVLAGCFPAAVICELVNDDGSVKKGEQVAMFARQHRLAMISIDHLIAWRQRRETLISCDSVSTLDTPIGSAQCHVYSTSFDDLCHLAVVFGSPSRDSPVLTRLHRENPGIDLFHRSQGLLGPALERIRREGEGVVVYLRAGEPVAAAPPSGEASRLQQWREVGLGAQILRDLGMTSIRLLAARERQYIGLAGFGIHIASTEILASEPPFESRSEP